MKFMYFSVKYHKSDILSKNINFFYNGVFCCNHTCYCVGMVSVTSASGYQNRSSMYIGGLILRNFTEKLAEAVPIDGLLLGILKE